MKLIEISEKTSWNNTRIHRSKTKLLYPELCTCAWQHGKNSEPNEVVATTYQAISGAGKTFKDWPEMVENIIPYIGGEEEKSEQEPLRVLGTV